MATHKITNLTDEIIRVRYNRIQLRFKPYESKEIDVTHKKDPMREALRHIGKQFIDRLEVLEISKIEGEKEE